MATEKPKVFSGIQPTGRKTLGNYSGGFRQYVQTQEQGDAFFCIVDLHSISVDYDPAELRELDARPRGAAVRRRARRRPLDRLLPEPRDRARRGGLAAVGGDGLRAAREDDAVQGEERRARVRLGRAVHVSGAHGRRHPPVPDRPRPDRRRPATAPRAHARRRAALQLPLRRDLPPARGRLPHRGRPDHGPAGAEEQDVDVDEHRAGRDLRRRPAGRDPQEVQDRGDRLGPRGPVRPGAEARRLEPARDHGRRHRRAGRRDRAAVRRRGLRRLQGGRRRGGRRPADADPGAVRGAARGRARAAAAARASAPTRRGARRSRRSRRCTTGWASPRPRPASCSAPRGRAGSSAAPPPCRNLSETASPPTIAAAATRLPCGTQGTAQSKRGVA